MTFILRIYQTYHIIIIYKLRNANVIIMTETPTNSTFNEDNIVQERTARIINFIGISLGFLIVAITQFKIEDIKSASYILYCLLNIFTFTGIFFFFISIVIGFLINWVTTDNENVKIILPAYPHKINIAFSLLVLSFYLGLLSIVLIITIVAFKSLIILASFIIVTIIAMIFIYNLIKNPL